MHLQIKIGFWSEQVGSKRGERPTYEVNILVLGDWQRLARELPSETPVIFRYDGKKPMETEEYCDGLRVYPSRMWDGYDGWKPCILVELGECF